MNESNKLTDLLRLVSQAIIAGEVDESAIKALARERDTLASAVGQMDEANRLRFAAIGSLLNTAASRIEQLESADVPLSKTWGRQDIAVAPDADVPLSKTWGRQDIAVAPDADVPLSKTWGRQDIAVPVDADVPLSKTWGRQDIAVPPDADVPLSKTWGRQDIAVAPDADVPLSKTWGRQEPIVNKKKDES